MAVGFCFFFFYNQSHGQEKSICYREILGYIHGCKKKKKNIAVKGTKMPRENCIYRKIIMWGDDWLENLFSYNSATGVGHNSFHEKVDSCNFQAMEERTEILLLQYVFFFFE